MNHEPTVQSSGRLASILCLVFLVACASEREGSKKPASLTPPAPNADESTVVSAMTASPTSTASAAAPPEPARFIELDVPKWKTSTVFIPPLEEGATRPLVVVTHGAGGRPEPHCNRYRAITKDQAFLLCTRGHVQNKYLPEPEQGFFYDGHPRLGEELLAAVGALKDKEGANVDTSHAMFAGYSQGASMGLLYLYDHFKRTDQDPKFTKVLLVEGGFRDWNVALAKNMKDDGVEKVALVCGQLKCHDEGAGAIRSLDHAGLPAKLWYAPGAGHTSEGPVASLVQEDYDWLLVP